MERLRTENCRIQFKTFQDMSMFLDEMFEADEVTELKLNTIKTGSNTEGLTLSGVAEDGKIYETKVWPLAIGSLEKRSEDTAAGHRLMSNEEILNSMNNYWKLHSNKKRCSARVRGGKLLNLESSRYVPMKQSEIINVVTDWLDDRHPGKYEFINGVYTHQMTSLEVEVKDTISLPYKTAWKKAGLPQNLLDDSKIFIKIQTNDIGESAAKAYIEMVVGGSKFLIGDPIEVIHKSGYGGIETFKDEFDKVDFKIREELDALSSLMKIQLNHPDNAAINALKKAGIVSMSKKACKELIDDMLFNETENAYIVYLYLHGIFDTSYGSKLSEYTKFRIATSLRTLLKANWSKFDTSVASL